MSESDTKGDDFGQHRHLCQQNSLFVVDGPLSTGCARM